MFPPLLLQLCLWGYNVWNCPFYKLASIYRKYVQWSWAPYANQEIAAGPVVYTEECDERRQREAIMRLKIIVECWRESFCGTRKWWGQRREIFVNIAITSKEIQVLLAAENSQKAQEYIAIDMLNFIEEVIDEAPIVRQTADMTLFKSFVQRKYAELIIECRIATILRIAVDIFDVKNEAPEKPKEIKAKYTLQAGSYIESSDGKYANEQRRYKRRHNCTQKATSTNTHY